MDVQSRRLVRRQLIAADGQSQRRTLLVAGSVLFVENIFYVGILPLLPVLAERHDLSSVGAGALVGSYAAGLIAGSVPAALLGRRIGFRRLAASGLCVLAASTAVFAIGDSIVVLDSSRFVQGIGAAFAWVGVLAWISAIAPRERRGRSIGIVMSFAVTGSILGPVAGALAVATSLVLVFGALAILQAALGIAVMRAPREKQESVAEGDSAASRGDARPVSARTIGLILVGLPATLAGVYEALTPLELDAAGAGTGMIAGVFVAGAVGEVVIGPLAGRASDRIGRLAPLRFALALAPPLCVAVTFADGRTALIVLAVLAWLAITTAFTPGLALIADLTQEGSRAAADWATLNVVLAAGVLAGSVGGPLIATSYGEAAPYLVLGAVSIIALAAATRLHVGVAQRHQGHHRWHVGNVNRRDLM